MTWWVCALCRAQVKAAKAPAECANCGSRQFRRRRRSDLPPGR